MEKDNSPWDDDGVLVNLPPDANSAILPTITPSSSSERVQVLEYQQLAHPAIPPSTYDANVSQALGVLPNSITADDYHHIQEEQYQHSLPTSSKADYTRTMISTKDLVAGRLRDKMELTSSDVPYNAGGEPSRISILLLGGTGVGKSSFIAHMTGSAVEIGHTLRACTHESKGWDYRYNSELMINFVDTPGFNDTTRSDMEILQAVVEYINDTSTPPIAGIIYLHPITDQKITGSARKNLEMLKAVCGEHFFQDIVLTTTMWNTVPESREFDMQRREKELTNGMWKDMLEKGSGYARYVGTSTSGVEIVNKILDRGKNQPLLKIIKEIKDGVKLEDTAAGQIITAELRKREEKRRQEEAEEEEEERREMARQKERLESDIRRRNIRPPPDSRENRTIQDTHMAFGEMPFNPNGGHMLVLDSRQIRPVQQQDTIPGGQNGIQPFGFTVNIPSVPNLLRRQWIGFLGQSKAEGSEESGKG